MCITDEIHCDQTVERFQYSFIDNMVDFDCVDGNHVCRNHFFGVLRLVASSDTKRMKKTQNRGT